MKKPRPRHAALPRSMLAQALEVQQRKLLRLEKELAEQKVFVERLCSERAALYAGSSVPKCPTVRHDSPNEIVATYGQVIVEERPERVLAAVKVPVTWKGTLSRTLFKPSLTDS